MSLKACKKPPRLDGKTLAGSFLNAIVPRWKDGGLAFFYVYKVKS